MFFIPKRMILFFIGFSFPLIGNVFSQGKPKDFQHLSLNEGLPVRWVRAINQDKNDFIWIGAANKVIKYDGYSFRSFESPMLRELKILEIVPDHLNKKWILIEGVKGEKDILIFDETTENYVLFSERFSLLGYPEISNPQAF